MDQTENILPRLEDKVEGLNHPSKEYEKRLKHMNLQSS